MSNDNSNSIKIFLEQRQKLIEKLATVEEMLGLLGWEPESNQKLVINKPKEVTINKDYDPKKALKYKVHSIISSKGRFLHSSEIKEEMARLEGIAIKAVKNISPALSLLKKANKVIKHQVGNQNRNSFWGKPEWLDSDDKPKKEFMYDESKLYEDSGF